MGSWWDVMPHRPEEGGAELQLESSGRTAADSGRASSVGDGCPAAVAQR